MNSLVKKYRIMKNIGITLTSIFGALFIFGFLGAATMVGGANILLGSLILFGPPLAIGLYLLIAGNKKLKKSQLNDRENLVLTMAAQNNGILTQAGLAKGTVLTIADSGFLLSEMVTKGIASVEVDDNGVIEYHFQSLKR
ncbi:MAG: hypothetical protein KIT33_13555 [Candidatus Kapabacteria bacterium]|nr:hypothetical protein [Ignavibacteriota bacterium]MCW5885991.1 hypothetical protein [Candidatus Kapabacteria bacterium]